MPAYFIDSSGQSHVIMPRTFQPLCGYKPSMAELTDYSRDRPKPRGKNPTCAYCRDALIKNLDEDA